MKNKFFVMIFLAMVMIPLAYPIEHNDDSYYCNIGEILQVDNLGVFSDRWQCTTMNDAASHITTMSGINLTGDLYLKNNSIYDIWDLWVDNNIYVAGDLFVVDTLSINGSYYPSVDDTFSLGESSYRWKEIYGVNFFGSNFSGDFYGNLYGQWNGSYNYPTKANLADNITSLNSSVKEWVYNGTLQSKLINSSNITCIGNQCYYNGTAGGGEGNVSGTGSNGQIAIWTSNSTINGTDGFYYIKSEENVTTSSTYDSYVETSNTEWDLGTYYNLTSNSTSLYILSGDSYPEVDSDMVLYMKFNNDSNVSEDYSQRMNCELDCVRDDNILVNDYSSSSNDATNLKSRRKWTTDGVSGNALEMDAFNDGSTIQKVTVAHQGVMDTPDNMTVSMWVRRVGGNSYYGRMFSRAPANFEIADLSGKFVYYYKDASGTGRPGGWGNTGKAISSEWQHIVFMYNGSMSVYINGTLQYYGNEGTTGLQNLVTSNYDIGGYDSNEGFNGSIDEVKVWNCTLSLADIQLLNSTPEYTPNCADGRSNQLIGHWAMNESSGNTASDSGPNNLDGALSSGYDGNTLTFNSTSKFNGGFEFDGVDDYIDVANENNFDFTDNFTMSVWVKLDSTQTGGIFTKYGSDSSRSYGIYMNTDTLYVSTYNSNSPSGSVSHSLPIGEWYHIVTKLENEQLYLYVNGTQVDYDSSATMSANNNEVIIGKWTRATDYFFNGSIDQVIIYNRSLNDSEIANLYIAGKDTYHNSFFESQVFDLSSYSGHNFTQIEWSCTLPDGSNCCMAYRNGSSNPISGGYSDYVCSSPITVGSSDDYFQYKLNVSRANFTFNPSVEEVTINYSLPSGTALVSYYSLNVPDGANVSLGYSTGSILSGFNYEIPGDTYIKGNQYIRDWLTVGASIISVPGFPSFAYSDSGNLGVLGDLGIIGDIFAGSNLNVAGDINQTGGNATINNYYGGMWLYNESGVAISIDDSYQIINGYDHSPHLNGFNFYEGEGKLQLTGESGVYQVVWDAYGEGTQNHLYLGKVYVNEEPKNNTVSRVKGEANNIVKMHGFGYININRYDNITLRIRDVGDTTTGAVYASNIDLLRVGS